MRPHTAVAHSNIALIKYWGKRSDALNLPAVGSLSLTLEAFSTTTTVTLDTSLREDAFAWAHGESDDASTRVQHFLNLVRRDARSSVHAVVSTANNFPTAAGLASSASGFAALARAATSAYGLQLDDRALSMLARRGSGSAARSVFGGFVLQHRGERDDGDDCFAEPLDAATTWPLRMIIAITSRAPKAIDSRSAMRLCCEQSPYYSAWVGSHPADLAAARTMIEARDFPGLAQIVEHNAFKMHACMLAANPPLLYWSGATIDAVRAIQELRATGVAACCTIDAGPQVKVLCEDAAAERVQRSLAEIPGVLSVIDSGPGPGCHLIDP